jgi:DNA-binding FadR family transcriptional regulator
MSGSGLTESLESEVGSADTRAMAESRRLYEQISQKLAKAIADGEYEIGNACPRSANWRSPLVFRGRRCAKPSLPWSWTSWWRCASVRASTSSIANRRTAGKGAKDIGPFELLEARRAIEGEACAMAALRIEDEQLERLSELIAENAR